MNIKIKVYNTVKYDPESIKLSEVTYNNVQSFKIEHRTDEEIFEMGFDETDEYQEYVMIVTESGEESTFRNSHVDIFRA